MPTPNNEKKCTYCKSDLNVEELKYAFHYKCKDCVFETYEWFSECCGTPNLHITKYYKNEEDSYITPDKYLVYKQCINCGCRLGTAFKRENYSDDNLPIFNLQLQRNRESERAEIGKMNVEAWKRNRGTPEDYWDDLDEYYKSERWKEIRQIVLKRDNNLCQSCLTEPAIQVHHTVGRYRKNEPIFSLVSVCKRCHEIITDMDRGLHRTVEKIIYQFDKK